MTKQNQNKSAKADKRAKDVTARVPDPTASLVVKEMTANKEANADTEPKKNDRRKQGNSSQSRKAESQSSKKQNPANKKSKDNNSPARQQTTSQGGDGVCTKLEDFSKKAQEIKSEIKAALEKQSVAPGGDPSDKTNQPAGYEEIREEILKISGLSEEDLVENESQNETKEENNEPAKDTDATTVEPEETKDDPKTEKPHKSVKINEVPEVIMLVSIDEEDELQQPSAYKSDEVLEKALVNMSLVEEEIEPTKSEVEKVDDKANNKPENTISNCLAPLGTQSDAASKYISLVSSLQSHFKGSPQLLEPICKELVKLSEQNRQLLVQHQQVQSENQKLHLVKQKLENLCRELQKSNNAIRIESLDLIKAEQGKAKEQTAKIQSTLSGVIKLFDENQQRNMSLRQENLELQQKLKTLLDHCDNWEKSVEATLRQRDLENKLVKTELAKANLVRNEEKERFLSEKKELLQLLSMMQEQQHKIEGQEAKLRSDLSSYASKYDECQAVISKGMSKFQTESKRMLQQIERSKQDYKTLLGKYEICAKRLTSLLEEKKQWTKSMSAANKKVETLEKLCRALQSKQAGARSDQSVDNTDNSNLSANNNDDQGRGGKSGPKSSDVTNNKPQDSQQTKKQDQKPVADDLGKNIDDLSSQEGQVIGGASSAPCGQDVNVNLNLNQTSCKATNEELTGQKEVSIDARPDSQHKLSSEPSIGGASGIECQPQSQSSLTSVNNHETDNGESQLSES